MMRKLHAEATTCTPETLRNCLEYLYQEAMNAGFTLPAHFIGVAAVAAADLIPDDPDEDDPQASLRGRTRTSRLTRFHRPRYGTKQ